MTHNLVPSADGPIGVFDSGVGGLSVAQTLLMELPQERLHYVADSVNCPYGPRTDGEIQALSEGIVRYLLDQRAKIIVVACNTASAAALEHLRAIFPQVHFVGMVPAVKPATQTTRSGIVGVLATSATLHGALYRDVTEHFATRTRVISQVCTGLVEQVEVGDVDGPETMRLLHACLGPLLGAGADTLVLGCTHYPFLMPAIRQLVGGTVEIIEPSAAVARQTARVLARSNLLHNGPQREHTYATTGDPSRFFTILRRLTGCSGRVLGLRWIDGALGHHSCSPQRELRETQSDCHEDRGDG